MRTKAIELEHSVDICFHDDSTGEENVIIGLLAQAYEKNLPKNSRIKITKERLKNNYDTQNPTEADLMMYSSSISLRELNNIYEGFANREFTPENEKERKDFKLRMLERQGEKEEAWAEFRMYNAIHNASSTKLLEPKLKKDPWSF